MTKIVIVPGLHDSSTGHWQSWLETHVKSRTRIKVPDWSTPDLKGWTQAILEALDQTGDGAILIAHSFGCLAAIRALHRNGQKVRGAILVAPADPIKFHFDPATFSAPLPVRTIMVGSENDHWMKCQAAQEMAEALGADFLNLGRAGHINVESGYGPWPGVLKLVRGLERPLIRTFRPDFAGRSAIR